MKNITGFLLSVASVFSNTLVMAGEKRADLIYCPKEIICNIDRDVNSCLYEQDSFSLWNKVDDHGVRNAVVVGAYQLYSVSAPYHSAKRSVLCQYTSVNERFKTLYVPAKSAANCEVFYEPPTLWRLGKSTGYCDSKNTFDCPLKEQSAISIHNAVEVNLDLKLSGNDSDNSRVIVPGDLFERILYEELDLCKNSDECILILSSQYGPIGKVAVDLNNNLKINYIQEDDYSIYKIDKVENFNAIEIKNSHEYPWFYVDIRNHLDLDLIIRVNENNLFEKPLKLGERAKAYYGQVYKNCHSFEICTLEFFSNNGMKIGKAVVDMKNDLHLIEVVSENPAEIILKQSGVYEIDVEYRVL